MLRDLFFFENNTNEDGFLINDDEGFAFTGTDFLDNPRNDPVVSDGMIRTLLMDAEEAAAVNSSSPIDLGSSENRESQPRPTNESDQQNQIDIKLAKEARRKQQRCDSNKRKRQEVKRETAERKEALDLAEKELKKAREQNETLQREISILRAEQSLEGQALLADQIVILERNHELLKQQNKNLENALKTKENELKIEEDKLLSKDRSHRSLQQKAKELRVCVTQKGKLIGELNSNLVTAEMRIAELERENARLKMHFNEPVTSADQGNADQIFYNFFGAQIQPLPKEVINLEAPQNPVPTSFNTMATGVSQIGGFGPRGNLGNQARRNPSNTSLTPKEPRDEWTNECNQF